MTRQLCSDVTALITEEVTDFLILGVFPNWTMVRALASTTQTDCLG